MLGDSLVKKLENKHQDNNSFRIVAGNSFARVVIVCLKHSNIVGA